jgi:hypothetical protein
VRDDAETWSVCAKNRLANRAIRRHRTTVGVRRFRLYIGEGREATAAGCALALLAAAVTVAVCLALGQAAVRWATPLVAWAGRWLAVAVVCGVLISPGALVFLAGAAALRRLGVPAWKEVGGDERTG